MPGLFSWIPLKKQLRTPEFHNGPEIRAHLIEKSLRIMCPSHRRVLDKLKLVWQSVVIMSKASGVEGDTCSADIHREHITTLIVV